MIGATLFSGIGAPETAMPSWSWPWHAEIEKFPAAVLAARHPDSVNLGDVSADDFADRAGAIARPDVLVFGSPCQSFSVAGKRLGMDDPRGNLAVVALGLAGRLRPDWFVFENVPGLLSSDGGRDFGALLGLVGELGYGFAYRVLDAQFFGVPQRRRRVFVVGHLGDWRRAAAVLFEPESMRGDTAPRREPGQRPAPTIASRPTGGGGLGTDFDCDGGLIASHDVSQPLLAKGNSSHRADAESYIAHTLNAKGGSGQIDGESETFIAHALRGEGFDASEDGTGRGMPLVPTMAFSQKDYGADVSVEIAPTMRAMGHVGSHANAGGQLAVAVALRGREGGATAELSDVPSALRASNGGGDKAHVLTAAPITSSMGKSIAGKEVGVTNGVVSASAVRRLTPRECERLQGFPDDHTLIEYRGKPAADGPRYKSLGNSMAVPVMRWILQRIESAAAQ